MTNIVSLVHEKLNDLLSTVGTEDTGQFLYHFRKLHRHDRAQYLFSQDSKFRQKLYGYLSPHEIAKLLEHIKPADRLVYLAEFDKKEAAEIVAKMYVDEAVDVINNLEPTQASSYLALMPEAAAKKISRLLQYSETMAGSAMTTEFVTIHQSNTAGQALAALKEQANRAVMITYAYVINRQQHLLRVVTLKELFLADKDQPVSQIGTDQVLTVMADDTKESAARLMKEYGLMALPVVDYHQRLVGVITIDDIITYLDKKAIDSFSKLATIADVELTDSPWVSATKRLPWLTLLLFLGMVTATLIGHFENTIAQVAILGAFIPVVAGTTGNSGTQSLAIVVRGIATGRLTKLSLRWYFFKEAGTALITSLSCGIVLTIIIYLWKQQMYIGLLAGFSLFLSIFIGTLVGSIVPLAMHRLHIDPAVASGPLITTICDIISMSIYFTTATMLMTRLV